MRADRLVATMLILQARGRVSAGELAAELEVSVKTAPTRPRGAGDRRRAGLRAAGPERRLVAARRGTDRPLRPDRRRGPDAVPPGRTVGPGRTGGEGRPAQARPRAPRAVPGGGGQGRRGCRHRPGALGPDPPAGSPIVRGPPTRGHRRHPGAARLRRPTGPRDRSRRPSTRPRPEGPSLVPHRRDGLGRRCGDGLRTFRIDRIRAAEPTGDPVVRPDGLRPGHRLGSRPAAHRGATPARGARRSASARTGSPGCGRSSAMP